MTTPEDIRGYHAIGLMSGTSLDGLDIAYCVFTEEEEGWKWKVLAAETIAHPPPWKALLAGVETENALGFARADTDFGHYCGALAHAFIRRHDARPLFIASHGHTIFHQPSVRLTAQIGKGSAIVAETGIPVVCDFRSTDVASGGQGAPLVPMGDALLFRDYGFCLNLGGFANISHQASGRRVAYDICPVNIVLNRLASRLGHEFDPSGSLARAGKVIPELLAELEGLPYYRQQGPRSLGKEWVLENIFPRLAPWSDRPNDLLATFTEHAALRISAAVKFAPDEKILVTGGGAFNEYLLERIRALSGMEAVIPDPLTVNFKEALVFAFLGLLRWLNRTNCLASVTGARRDSCGGAIYIP